MVFLLCADDQVRSKVLQQQLYVASFTPQEPTIFLHSWASEMRKTNSEWRYIFLEALCIIQAKAIIRKLGLNYIDLEQQFLPRIPNSTLHIHPMLKLLYFVNENLTVAESKELVDRMDQDFDYRDNALLNWLGEDVLNIGRRSTTDRNQIDEARAKPLCNFDLFIEFLKENEKDSLKEMVSSACQQFNSTQNVFTDRPIIRTNDKKPIDMGVSNAKSIRTSNADDSFKIRKSNAGIVLVLNQKTFHLDDNPALREFLPARMLEKRKGTDQDVASLKRTFAAFGYRIDVKENCIHTDLLENVRNAVNECAGKDSLIVCILSHGYKGVVYGANSIPIKIEDIENLMTSHRLIGKPKILIVQACQGDVTQQAREVSVDRLIAYNTQSSIKYLHFAHRLTSCNTMAHRRKIYRLPAIY